MKRIIIIASVLVFAVCTIAEELVIRKRDGAVITMRPDGFHAHPDRAKFVSNTNFYIAKYECPTKPLVLGNQTKDLDDIMKTRKFLAYPFVETIDNGDMDITTRDHYKVNWEAAKAKNDLGQEIKMSDSSIVISNSFGVSP